MLAHASISVEFSRFYTSYSFYVCAVIQCNLIIIGIRYPSFIKNIKRNWLHAMCKTIKNKKNFQHNSHALLFFQRVPGTCKLYNSWKIMLMNVDFVKCIEKKWSGFRCSATLTLNHVDLVRPLRHQIYKALKQNWMVDGGSFLR